MDLIGEAQRSPCIAPDARAAAAIPMPSDLSGPLLKAIGCLDGLGEGYEHTSDRLGELRERLAQGRFHLAVLGQVKRGKSTLLNALLGEVVLPTAVVPLTAIPTFIHPGQALAARVHFQDQREPQDAAAATARQLADFLAGFVSEAGNPRNRLDVERVEVLHPAALPGKGVVLIETPGIGSTFRHNTEATLNFLPQCDAAVFLVSADPPITEVEVEFLRQVRSKVARLFFICNKVDCLSDDDREAALGFLRKVLVDQVGVPGEIPVVCVSARQGLEARARGDEALWTANGLAQVERHLVEFLATEKASALREAVSRQAADATGEGLMRLRLAMRSLQMPLEALEQRLSVFEAKIDEGQRQRVAAGNVLAGDLRRMHEFLEEHAGHLRGRVGEYLGGIVQETPARNGEAVGEAVQAALAEAIPGHFEHQAGATTELFRQRMAQVLRPHQERADELIESVRKAAAELFEVPYHAPESADAFEFARQPYWVTHTWSSRLGPIPVNLVDRLTPAAVRQKRVRKRLLAQVAQLVIPNVEHLRWAMFQSIDQNLHAVRLRPRQLPGGDG